MVLEFVVFVLGWWLFAGPGLENPSVYPFEKGMTCAAPHQGFKATLFFLTEIRSMWSKYNVIQKVDRG